MLVTSFKVGLLLAIRRIQRSSILTTGLIIFVMTLTFLNLIVSRGILVGLPQGATDADKERYTGDIIISSFKNNKHLNQENRIINSVKNTPGIKAYTVRYITGVEAAKDFDEKIKSNEELNKVNTSIIGINPEHEDAVTNLANYVIAGSYLNKNDTDTVVLGENILTTYTPSAAPGEVTLDELDIGDKIELKIGENIGQFNIGGVVSSKVQDIDRAIFITESELERLLSNGEFKADEISIRINNGTTADTVKEKLLETGIQKLANVQTAEEAQPTFLKDIIVTFSILGNAIGSIGLGVASITVFIVIFVSAITRRKYIGILKGIGINGLAIEISYVLQSIFYAMLGSLFGIIIVYGVLVPFFINNPIDFPFADGTLVAEYPVTINRVIILLVATIIAGYIPAKLIVRENTLDAILGR